LWKNLGTKFSGLTIQLLAFLGLTATTAMSISGGIGGFKGDARKFAFAVTLIFAQLTIFKVSTCETIVKRNFNSHYVPLKLIQTGLLLVSINYNYKFFNDDSIITLLLCILVDTSVIKFVTLAADMKSMRTEVNQRAYSLLGIVFYNLVANFKLAQIKKYQVNYEKLTQVNPLEVSTGVNPLELKEPGLTQEEKLTQANPLELKEPGLTQEEKLTRIQSHIDGLTKDELVRSGEIKVNFGLTKRDWEKLVPKLTHIKKVGTKLKKT